MHLQENEEILKVFHHHPLARFIRAFKIVVAGLPFFLVAWFFRDLLMPHQMLFVYSGVALLISLAVVYDSVLYYLDRLVITNRRILYIDWNGFYMNIEHEAELVDIQDIETKEKGIFAALPIFDFGDFILETASTQTTIHFPNAPDPEGIKHFIYHLSIKPNRIRGDGLSTLNDQTRETKEDAAAVARRQ